MNADPRRRRGAMLTALVLLSVLWAWQLQGPRRVAVLPEPPTLDARAEPAASTPTKVLPGAMLDATAGARAAAAPLVAASTPRRRVGGASPIPVMAYYYIWFDGERSWQRAKRDMPLLGPYSSDDPAVMQQHIRWAQDAGIDGFIVSWKGTEVLDRRLEQLAGLADEAGFALWVIYQGLDFQRQPVPVTQIESDLDHFLARFAWHPSFHLLGKPVVILSGTWEFSTSDVFAATNGYRGSLRLLASERNADGYRRLANLVDGNAYYWSSVNPSTFPGYAEKLAAMGDAVRRRGGMWVAPAAPGFDATLLGGDTVVERHDGATLRSEMGAALRSSPDAVGLISFNEFSENTHVEPSRAYGTQALETLTGRATAPLPVSIDVDSSAPGTTDRTALRPYLTLLVALLALVGSVATVIARALRAATRAGVPGRIGR